MTSELQKSDSMNYFDSPHLNQSIFLLPVIVIEDADEVEIFEVLRAFYTGRSRTETPPAG